jgi:hypothetical protein
MAAAVMGVWTARSLSSWTICAASSRVGVTMSAPRGAALRSDELVKDRQQESGGFAAPGCCGGQDVASLHRWWDSVCLDRRWLDEAELLDAAQEVGVKLE